MQRLATLATLALASHGARLGAATVSHGSPTEAEQLTLAELLDESEQEFLCMFVMEDDDGEIFTVDCEEIADQLIADDPDENEDDPDENEDDLDENELDDPDENELDMLA